MPDGASYGNRADSWDSDGSPTDRWGLRADADGTRRIGFLDGAGLDGEVASGGTSR